MRKLNGKLPKARTLQSGRSTQGIENNTTLLTSGHWEGTVGFFATRARMIGASHIICVNYPTIPYILNIFIKQIVKSKNKVGYFGRMGGLAV